MDVVIKESEKELYPSEWTHRFDSTEDGMKYVFEHGQKGLAENAKYLQQKDVRYGTGAKQLLDIYCKEEETGTPIVVFFHGGYWQMFSKELSVYWIAPYIEKGCRVIIVGYDLCPSVTLLQQIGEVHDAIKYVLQYAVDSKAESLCVLGHSAGAHLVISALDKQLVKSQNFHLIKAVFLFAGIYDTEVLLDTTVNKDNLLSIDRSTCEKVSPLRFDFEHLRATNFPIYVLAAEHESPLFIEHSEKMAKRLLEFGARAEFRLIKNVDHGDIVEKLDKFDYDLTHLLLDHLGK